MSEMNETTTRRYRQAIRDMETAKESMAACEASLGQQRALHAAGNWHPRPGDGRSYQEWRVSALVALGRYRKEFSAAKAEVRRLAAIIPQLDRRSVAIEAARHALTLCSKAMEEE